MLKPKKYFIIFILVLVIVVFIYLKQVKKLSFDISEKPNVELVDTYNKKNSDFEILATNLEIPWAIDFLPDERLIFTQRPGEISILDNGKIKVVGKAGSSYGEAGLLGIAVDPDFNKNKFVYLYYTNNDGNKISRFILNNDKLTEETVLLDGIRKSSNHDGGRLKFGPDGKLYATTGDALNPQSAQDINSLSGKILRMNKDGSIPEDNPFGNYIYSYGHRNPQGIAWHPKTGELFASEHGNFRNDEINLIVKGKNYGWPEIECDKTSKEVMSSIRCFDEFTLAPSGIAFYRDDLYVVGLRGEQLRKIALDENYNVIKEEIIVDNLGRLREVVVHKGYLYISTSNIGDETQPIEDNDKIVRINLDKIT